jgi:D-lyxose ketol-isomerase
MAGLAFVLVGLDLSVLVNGHTRSLTEASAKRAFERTMVISPNQLTDHSVYRPAIRMTI